MSFESWKRENEAQGVVAESSGFDKWKQENAKAGIIPTGGNYAQQLVGALTKGGMSVGRAITEVPRHLGKTISMLEPGSEADYFKQQEKDIAAEEAKITADPKYKPPLWYKLSKSGEKAGATYSGLSKEHKLGMAVILDSHPEWESEPPENFLDLLTSPRKLSLAVTEAIPLLLAAGVTTAAGAPQVALGMMYATEGQGMYDQAIADGASPEQAEVAYHLYGSVAAILENLQLSHIMKGSKGLYGAVLGRTAQKLAGKSITVEIVKIAAQEALEEISQGTWQEATAKIVYGKDPEGGLTGFIDRRAQEGLIGFTMGLGAGGGGAVAGKIAQRKVPPVKEEPARKKEERELLAGTPYGEANIPGLTAKIFTVSNIADTLTAKTKVPVKGRKQKMQTLSDEHAAIIAGYEKVSDVIDKNPDALSELVAIKNLLPAYTEAVESFKKNPTRETRNTVQEITDKIGELRGAYADKLAGIKDVARIAKGVETVEVKREKQIVDKYLAEHDASKGTVPARKPYLSSRDEQFAAKVAEGKEPGRPSAILPDEMEHAEDAIRIGKKLGYHPDDIAAYLQENYITKPQAAEVALETPDQAIGKQYGLEPTETQTRLDDAEVRYRELKNKPTKKRSKAENKELAFLRRNRTNIEAILERETSPIENKMPRKKIFELGHRIPELLGMTELQRRDFNREITGQISMKDMTPAQRQQVVTALGKEAKERGIDMKTELKTSPVGELVVKLEERKQKPMLTRRDKRNLTKLRRVMYSLKSGTGFYFLHMSRLKRVCRALDNYEDDGPFTKYIHRPTKTGDTQANVNFSNVMRIAIESFNEADIDVSTMMTEVKDIGIKTKLTTAERIGVFALAQNENTMNHLLSEFDKDEVAKIAKSVKESKDEMYVADSIKAYFEHGWPMFQQIAKASGVASGLVKEKNYITAFVTDKNDLNQTDFLEGLTQPFAEGKKVPGQELTIKRKRGARRNIELNIFTIHARAARSIERFKVMAPLAKKVGGIMNNRKFKQAMNNATYGHGVGAVNMWLRDSIRGSAAYDTSVISKSLRCLRTMGIYYVLGYKILTAGKQGISLLTAASIHPGMVPLLVANMTNNAMPGRFSEMINFVESKSDLVKTRDWNRDLRTAWDTKAVKKLYAGKKLSPISMRMASAVDHFTVVTVWKSAYQLAQMQNMNEEESVQFADGVIERTQPMGKAVDLPNFFRGNELERNLTIFQNQVNQNGNMLWYDIFGEWKAKKISTPMMSYRLLASQILPALLLGMISRGRPPEDIKEVAKDMFMYLVSPFTFLGPWIYNIAVGEYGPRRMIAETALVETAKLGAAVRSGDPEKIIKRGARAVGAWSGGKIPLQAITTAEGAWRLANGETKDFRELVWSQYALKSKKKKTGGFTY